MSQLFDRASSFEEHMQGWRRYLHANPEVGMETENTASFIEKTLADIGVKNVRRCAGTGVVALIEGQEPGDCIGLRADIDALPVQEHNALPFRSKIDGIAHACGHDVHATCLLGAARLLQDMRSEIKGSIKLIFQPGEEVMTGAAAMIADGVLDYPKLKSVFAFHVSPDFPAGTIVIRKGPVLASAQWVNITVRGTQGHAAHPHQCVDAVLIAGHVICALQSIMSREISPIDSGVFSLCRVEGGTAGNILPEEVRLTGTVRALSKEVNRQILCAAKRITEGIASTMRGSATFEALPGLPPLVNEDAVYFQMRDTFMRTFGRENVVDLPVASMGGEDFAFFLDQIPGGHFRVGVGSKERHNSPLHSTDFMVNESSLPYGATALAVIALNELGSLK